MQTSARCAIGAFVGLVATLLCGLAALPAAAKGAPIDPMSRAAECGPEGPYRATTACAAAVAVSGGRLDWDNLRLTGVGGQDRKAVPDGRLCSAGLKGFAGFDEPRPDWPTTTLSAGDELTVTYRATVPHPGTFRLYLTRQGYDPSRPLRWADLDTDPFLTVTDPALVDGTYLLTGRLPAGRTGQHLIYTVWQNSDRPDTYYSCSDVVLTPGDGSASAPDTDPADPGATALDATDTATETDATETGATDPADSGDPALPAASVVAAADDRDDGGGVSTPALAVGAIVVLGAAALLNRWLRTGRRGR